MWVSVYRRSEMGLSGCKVHSADAVAQESDEGRGNICVSVQLGGLSSQGNSTETRQLERFCGQRNQMYRSIVVVIVASSSSRSGKQ